MKQGINLEQASAELYRQGKAKRDFIVPTQRLAVDYLTNTASLGLGAASDVTAASPSGELQQLLNRPVAKRETFQINPYAHRQLGELVGVDAKLYDRLKVKHPDLLNGLVNPLLTREPEKRMVRTLDGNVRAVLSDKYRPLDNWDLAQAVLPILFNELDGVVLESCQFTETRFYIKASLPKQAKEIKKGDILEAAIVISNSEIGAGSLAVYPMTKRLVCLNGMTHTNYGQRRAHIGKRQGGDSDAAIELYSDQTKALDDAAFFSKVQDVVRGTVSGATFDRIVTDLQKVADQPIEGKIEEVVEVAAQRFGYTETTAEGILQQLIKGGDLTRWGLANAITRQSQDEENYDTATQLEIDGGRVMELGQAEWQSLLTKPVRKAA